jgi:hypothetical protein
MEFSDFIIHIVSLLARLQTGGFKGFVQQSYQLKTTLVISGNQLMLFIHLKSCLVSYMQM